MERIHPELWVLQSRHGMQDGQSGRNGQKTSLCGCMKNISHPIGKLRVVQCVLREFWRKFMDLDKSWLFVNRISTFTKFTMQWNSKFTMQWNSNKNTTIFWKEMHLKMTVAKWLNPEQITKYYINILLKPPIFVQCYQVQHHTRPTDRGDYQLPKLKKARMLQTSVFN